VYQLDVLTLLKNIMESNKNVKGALFFLYVLNTWDPFRVHFFVKLFLFPFVGRAAVDLSGHSISQGSQVSASSVRYGNELIMPVLEIWHITVRLVKDYFFSNPFLRLQLINRDDGASSSICKYLVINRAVANPSLIPIVSKSIFGWNIPTLFYKL
jgi:hypothetical protein